MVRLQSGNTDLDLGEFSTTLTFSIADIREPDKRNSSFSKTLTLPGTKANNIFFENMFEVDVETQTFNPNLKANTILSVDGVTQFKGALKLRQVNYLLNGEVTYDCNLIGNLSDFIQSLGTKKLRDLDLSAYDHEFSKDNAEAGWSPTIGVGYCYPMINYGETTNLAEWFAGYFRPAPFAKTVWDAIFNEAGFQYGSNFITSTFFKHLIIPNSNDRLRLTSDQVNERLFQTGRSSAQTFTDVEQFPFFINNIPPNYYLTTLEIDDDSSGIYFDNDGSFDTTNFWHEPNYTGTNSYILTCDVTVSLTKNIGSAGYGFDYEGLITAQIMRERNGVITQMNSFFLSLAGVAANAAGTYTKSGTISVVAENCDVAPGDHYYIVLRHAVLSTFNTTLIEWSIDNIIFRDQVVNDVVNLGDTIVLANSLPDMLQKDFIMGLVRMFNLYMEPDQNDELLLNIEPRNTYYNASQVDWTGKLAREKPLEIEPMALLNFKRLTCTYRPDDDYYNKQYKNETARVYGDYRAEILNDFVTGEYKIETNFAPTPLQGNYENDRIIPAIFGATGTPPAMELVTGQPRILYWGGLKNCEQWDFRYFSQHSYKTQYPYAGHLDDPQSPTIDLSFGVPLKVYYGVNQFIPELTYTDNNLFNGYYAQMISEITDRDSKMVTGYFWLNPVDILNLDFRKVYRVQSHALRLNKIYDYNPVKPTLTKCEFIKIKDTAAFTTAAQIMNGGLEKSLNTVEDTPVIDMGTYGDFNTVRRRSASVITGVDNYGGSGRSIVLHGMRNRAHGFSSGVAIFGEDNIVQDGASGVTVFGYGNNVGFSARNIFVQGRGNTILPLLQNVALVNTDNVTVTESDTTYINNEAIPKSRNNCTQYCTDWLMTQSKTLNSTPLDIAGMEAPGVGRVLIPRQVLIKILADGVAFDYVGSLQLKWGGQPLGETTVVVEADLNGAVDYTVSLYLGGSINPNDKLQLFVGGADAKVGTNKIYYKVIYQEEAAP